jgi:glycosyltransferase involved in cell wall biosynthesis
MWTHRVLGPAAGREKLDVLFVPAHVLPFGYKGKSVVTIHDLAFMHFPQAYGFWERKYQIWSTKYALKKCHKIIVPSNQTKEDLIRFFNANPEKIAVISHGFALHVVQPREANVVEPRAPYFLFVGRVEARKNVRALILAFKILKDKFNSPHQLLIAGKDGFGAKEIKALVRSLGLESSVSFLGYVDETLKAQLYQNAEAFVFPTLYEGFGFPVLEAQNFGAPVICSDIPVLREVAGDAAIFVSSGDPEEIALQMFLIAKDDKMKTFLKKEGLRNVKRFSWQVCARKTLEVLEGKND